MTMANFSHVGIIVSLQWCPTNIKDLLRTRIFLKHHTKQGTHLKPGSGDVLIGSVGSSVILPQLPTGALFLFLKSVPLGP